MDPSAPLHAASPATSLLPVPQEKPPMHLPAPSPATHTASSESQKKLPYKSQTTPVRERKPSHGSSKKGLVATSCWPAPPEAALHSARPHTSRHLYRDSPR